MKVYTRQLEFALENHVKPNNSISFKKEVDLLALWCRMRGG